MTLRQRASFVWAVGHMVLALTPFALIGFRWPCIALAWVTILASPWTWRVIYRAAIARAHRRMNAALTRREFARARRIMRDMLSLYPRAQAHAFADLCEGIILLAEDHLEAARDRLRACDATRLTPPSRRYRDAVLALCLSLLHQETQMAEELARGVIIDEPRRDAQSRAFASCALGVIALNAGRYADAAIKLEQARGRVSGPRLYGFLGDAYTALHQLDDARRAYEAGAKFTGEHGQRCRDRIQAGAPAPYR